MLWIWFCPVTTKELFLKIAAPKRQAKSLKATCKVVSFYYICKLYTWNIWKQFSQAFLKGFAKIACDVKLWNSKKSNNLLCRNFSMFINNYYFINLLLFSFFFFSKCLSSFFLGKSPSDCVKETQKIHVWKKHPPKNV